MNIKQPFDSKGNNHKQKLLTIFVNSQFDQLAIALSFKQYAF